MFGWKEKRKRGAERLPELGSAMDGLLITGRAGFLGGTHVASNLGWRTVEALSVGDRILTFDHGMQVVVDIQRETLFIPGHELPVAQQPILVPEGALNNRKDLWIMPDQGMLVESEAAADALGDPFAVIPACALLGLRGIHPATPGGQLHVTTLAFSQDEVIYVEGGLLAHCPRPRCILTDDPAPDGMLYNVLTLHEARQLVERLIEEDAADALTCAPEEIVSIVQKNRARPTRSLAM